MSTKELVTLLDIAKMLGISKQGLVCRIQTFYNNWPPPAVVKGNKKLWYKGEIEQLLMKTPYTNKPGGRGRDKYSWDQLVSKTLAGKLSAKGYEQISWLQYKRVFYRSTLQDVLDAKPTVSISSVQFSKWLAGPVTKKFNGRGKSKRIHIKGDAF